jgi:putative flippase GtrA
MKAIFRNQESKTLTELILVSGIEFLRAQVSAFAGGIIDYLIMIICIEWFDISLIPAIIIGGSIGAVINFLINRYWTFKNHRTKLLPQLIKFITAAMGSILLKATGTHLLTNALGVDYKITRLITDAFVCFGFNFLIQKFWVFKKQTL